MTPASALAQARSLLFVPGHRLDRLASALASGADAVVLDLEDSVPPGARAAARRDIAAALAATREAAVPVLVRINAPASAAGRDDLAWLARGHVPAGIVVSKAESAGDLLAVQSVAAGAALLPLIESAAGLDALAALATAPQVLRLVVGHLDFMADTGIRCSSADEHQLDPLRFAVAVQSARARLAAPIDGVTTALDDEERLQTDTLRALHFGFGGKLCIHPRQVAAVHRALAPTAEELDRARRIVDADARAGGAAVQLDGLMVDRPVVLQARRTLARAGLAVSNPPAGPAPGQR